MLIGSLITVFVMQNKLGFVTGADGGYIVSGERYIPDTAFMSVKRQPIQPDVAYNPVAPDRPPLTSAQSGTTTDMPARIVVFISGGANRRRTLHVPMEKR
jgi:hypothetical protein